MLLNSDFYPILPLVFFLVISKNKYTFSSSEIKGSFQTYLSYAYAYYKEKYFNQDITLFIGLHDLLFSKKENSNKIVASKSQEEICLPGMEIGFLDNSLLNPLAQINGKKFKLNVNIGLTKTFGYKRSVEITSSPYNDEKNCMLTSIYNLFDPSIAFSFNINEELLDFDRINKGRETMKEAINFIYNTDSIIKKDSRADDCLSDSQKLEIIYKKLNPKYYDINLICFFFITHYSQDMVDNLCDDDTLKLCKKEKLLERAYKKEFRRLYKPKIKNLRHELKITVPKSKLKDSANEREIIELKLAISKNWDSKVPVKYNESQKSNDIKYFKDTETFINDILTLQSEEKSKAYWKFFIKFMKRLKKTEEDNEDNQKFKLTNRNKLATQIIYCHACVQFLWEASHGLEAQTLQSLNDLLNCIYPLRE